MIGGTSLAEEEEIGVKEDRATATPAAAEYFEAKRGWVEALRVQLEGDPHYDHLDDIDYYDDELQEEQADDG